jgi:N-acetylmuramoyl-L-alanine amidase
MPFASAADTANQNTTSTESTTDQTLKLGMTGEKVSELQKWLKEGHFYTGEIDGNYSRHTEESVKLFQKTVGLKEDGEVGNITQNYIKLWDQGKITAMTTNSQSISTTSTTNKSTGTTKKYSSKTYSTSSSYSSSRYNGYINGMDCWAMSDSISGQLQSQGYQTRTLQYATSMSSNHRTVQYYNNGAWVNAPQYNSLPNIYSPTGNIANGVVVC